MKWALFIFFLSFSFQESHAQILFSQDWTFYQQLNIVPPWSVVPAGLANSWNVGNVTAITALGFPVINDDPKVAGVSDNGGHLSLLLVSPVINLASVGNAFLRYDSYFERRVVNGKHESATVEVSTDNGTTWAIAKNAPVSTIAGQLSTSFVNLSSYCGNASVRLGFRYSDSSEHMLGWLIDNLQVYVPAQNDLAMVDVQPADSMLNYHMQGDSVQISGKVFNAGLQPVTAFTVSLQAGNGTVVRDSFNNVNIQPLDSFSYTLSRRAVIAGLNRYVTKAWANTAGDTHTANDTMGIVLHGVSFIPKKVAVVEEGTGNWFPFAPQQRVYMEALRKGDDPVTLVSLHDQDGLMMSDPAYVHYVEDLHRSYVPFFVMDRAKKVDATHTASVIVNPTTIDVYPILDSALFFSTFSREKDYFGFASISGAPSVSSASLDVDVTINPATDLHGDLRLILVLTEDSVTGAGSGFDLANYYHGGGFGAMGGYENLANPVPAAAMVYHSVARSVGPSPDGNAGDLPPNMYPGNTYTASLSAPLSNQWKYANLKASVILYRNNDSTILNSAAIPMPPPLAVNDPQAVNSFNAALFPNPATESVNVVFQQSQLQDAVIIVQDITGKLITQKVHHSGTAGMQQVPVRLDGIAAGLYMVTIHCGNQSRTLKMSVSPR